MAATRLPVVGSDTATWGTILNAYLRGIVFHVGDYGATGDGTTDDRAAIVAADSAAAAVKGKVYYPPGTYRISSPVTPSAGVTHEGASEYASIITVLPANFGNFSFGYMFSCTNANVTIRNLGFDGQKRNGANPANQCGGVLVGPSTRLERVRVDDPNYYGYWINSTAVQARMIDCRGARGGNADSIGGGGGNDVKIIRHVWESTLAGNRFDNVGGTDVVLQDCVNLSSNAGGVYFEGMTRSGAEGCYVPNVAIRSDGGYAPATVTNPLECFARNNTIVGGQVEVVYNQTITAANVGGYNTVRGNHIENAPAWGILVLLGWSGTWSNSQDVIEDNIIINPNALNSSTANTGVHVVLTGAIVLDTAGFVYVRRNRTIDTWGGGVRTQEPVTTVGGNGYYLENNTFGSSVSGINAQNGALVYARNNAGWNPQGVAAITVTASPFTYTAGISPETVYIRGGTVSNITKSGTSLFVATNCTVGLGPNQSIVVTYSAAPTMVTDRQ